MSGLVKNRFSRMWGYGQNDKGVVLLAVLATSMILMVLGVGYYMKNTMEVQLVVQGAEQTQSFYGAEAGINWGLRELQLINVANGSLDYDWLTTVDTPAGTVYVAYRRKDLTPGDLTDDEYDNNNGFLYATTLDQNGEQERTLVVEVSIELGDTPFNAATLSGPNGSGGGFVIDGRNHKMKVEGEGPGTPWSAKLAQANTGTLGIITDAGDFNRKGNSTIGGTTEDNQDVEPTTDRYGEGGWEQEGQEVVDLFREGLKHSPDDVLLYTTQGRVKERAQDPNEDGDTSDSTYFLNPPTNIEVITEYVPPDNIEVITDIADADEAGKLYLIDANNDNIYFPEPEEGDPNEGCTDDCDYAYLKAENDGIYYFEFDANDDVDFKKLELEMFNPSSTAIVVVHHTCQDDPNCRDDLAIEEDDGNPNYQATMKVMSGTFKGVLIADQVDKIHGNIVGSLVTIGYGDRKSIGNGNGGVYYSKEVADRIAQNAGLIGEMKVVRWEEDNSKDVTRGIF